MRKLISTPFSSYFSALLRHKNLFIVLFLSLVISEWIGYSSTGLGASSTIGDATGVAVTNIFMTYFQWVIIGASTAIVASREVKASLPNLKFSKLKAFSQLIKSMFVWLLGVSISIMISLIVIMMFGFDAESQSQQGFLLVAFAGAAFVMFLSLVYAVAAFQQFIVNDLVKQTILGKKSEEYVNGYLVPFWIIKEIHTLWKSFLFLFIMILLSGLKGWVLVLGYPSVNWIISSVIGLQFVLVMTAGIPLFAKQRVDNFE